MMADQDNAIQTAAAIGGKPRLAHLYALVSITVTSGALDQLTKWMASSMLRPGEPVQLIPGLLDLQLRANPNGAFGLFSWMPDELRLPLLLSLAAIAMAVVVVISSRTLGWTQAVSVSLGLVLGGALANQFDRLFRGQVVDFIHLHWAEEFHWPTFNLADMAISAGTLMLLLMLSKRFFVNRDPLDDESHRGRKSS